MSYVIVKNLKKSYGKNIAVKNISFEVSKKAFFAFLGPNGAGKSSTINIITTLLQKDEGSVIIDGFELGLDDAEIRNKIGVVFQTNMLDNRLSVKQNLIIRGSFYKMNKTFIKEQVHRLTKELKMEGFINKKYGILSGGQKRRADIARALIHEPDLLILDEPTTGLDPKTREDVWVYIEKLRNKNMTIFLTTHYMEEASKATDVVIIDQGEIVARGTPEDLKSRFSHDMLKLYGDKEKIVSYLKSKKMNFEIKGKIIHVKISSIDAIQYINSLKSFLKSYEMIKGTMDDVFLNITGRDLE